MSFEEHSDHEQVPLSLLKEEDHRESDAGFDAHEGVEIKGREVLAQLESENVFLDQSIAEQYGPSFVEKLRARSALWGESLQSKGNSLLEWAKEKGVPIPESKRGLRIASAASGVAGAVVPGLGFLLPVSYILWQRSTQEKSEGDGTSDLLGVESGMHYA